MTQPSSFNGTSSPFKEDDCTMSKLPTDDLELEMQEIEGLTGIRSNNPPARTASTCALLVRGFGRRSCFKNKSNTKWCGILLVIAVVLIVLFLDDSEEISTIEADLDQHLKNHTKIKVADGHAAAVGNQDSSPISTDGNNAISEPAKEAEDKSPEPEKETENTASEPAKGAEDKASEPANEDKAIVQENDSSSNTEDSPEKAKSEPFSFSYSSEGLFPTNEKDYFSTYPNRDIPLDKLPKEAWQQKPDAVHKFLDNGLKLVNVAMEAILAEYGHGASTNKPFEERMDMFKLQFIEPDAAKNMKGNDGGPKAGTTTRRSFDGLVRRILHALVTGDTFTAVLGGHSAAAGHGNYFKQSYMMQFHEVMKPVFERLGVKLVSRNLAQGGLGTIQSAMGSGSLYGNEIDILVWDSGMTEGRDRKAIDLFWRQALIGGNRVPIMFGAQPASLASLHQNVDADFVFFGTGMSGIPTVESDEQAQTIPFSARYLKCTSEANELCMNNRFRGTCWIDRPDVKPPTKQANKHGGQVKWHPGFRFHRLQGRVFSFIVLQALQEALTKWNESEGQKLKDTDWHVTDYYSNIQGKVKSYKEGPCYTYAGQLPTRMCDTVMRASASYTPRANPEENDILDLVKPDSDGYVPRVQTKMVYEGPDVHDPNFDTPEGEVDVVKLITGNRRQLKETVSVQSTPDESSAVKGQTVENNLRGDKRNLADSIVVGKGWQASGIPPGRCGGEYDDICGRQPSDSCLLQGHHDARGGIIGTENAGWLVLNLKKVKEGIIVLKFESWHSPSENSRTANWKTVNNERSLKAKIPDIPDTFVFDVAINGNIQSWNKTQFVEHDKVLQRVVEGYTVLDDPDFTNGQEQDVEVAMRLRGMGNARSFEVTHVYWA